MRNNSSKDTYTLYLILKFKNKYTELDFVVSTIQKRGFYTKTIEQLTGKTDSVSISFFSGIEMLIDNTNFKITMNSAAKFTGMYNHQINIPMNSLLLNDIVEFLRNLNIVDYSELCI